MMIVSRRRLDRTPQKAGSLSLPLGLCVGATPDFEIPQSSEWRDTVQILPTYRGYPRGREDLHSGTSSVQLSLLST